MIRAKKSRTAALMIAFAMVSTCMVPQMALAGTSQAELKAALDSAKQQVESTKSAYERALAEYEAALKANEAGDVAGAYKNLIKQQENLIAAAKKDANVSASLIRDLEVDYKNTKKYAEEFDYAPPTLESAQQAVDAAEAEIESAQAKFEKAKNGLSEARAGYASVGKQFLDERSGYEVTIDQLAARCKSDDTLCADADKFDLALNGTLNPDSMIAAANTIISYNQLRKQSGQPEMKTGYDLMLLSALSVASTYSIKKSSDISAVLTIFGRIQNGKLDDSIKKKIKGYISYVGWYDRLGSFTYDMTKAGNSGIETMTLPEIVVNYPKFVSGSKDKYIDNTFADVGYAMTTADADIGYTGYDAYYPISRRELQIFAEASQSVTAETFIRELKDYSASAKNDYLAAENRVNEAKEEVATAKKKRNDNQVTLGEIVTLSESIQGIEETIALIKKENPGKSVTSAAEKVRASEKNVTIAEQYGAAEEELASKKQALDQAKGKYDEAANALEAAEAAYAPYRIDISDAVVSSKASIVYTGEARKALQSIEYNGKTLSDGDYDVTYRNNTNIGTATMSITGRGEYKGTVMKTFKIVPGKAKAVNIKKGKKSLTVTWKKPTSPVTGYQIKVCKSKQFKKGVKTVNTKGVKKTVKTIKRLKAKKTYYVKIRSYKMVSGVKYYSAWSGTKKIKTK